MTSPVSEPPGSSSLERRFRKTLMLMYLSTWLLLTLGFGGLLFYLQTKRLTQAEGMRAVNQIRESSASIQKLILQSILHNQAAAVDKDRTLREARATLEDAKNRWSDIQSDSFLLAQSPQLLGGADPKFARLTKRVETVLDMRTGVPLTREDFGSLYLLQSEFLGDMDKIAGFYATTSHSSAGGDKTLTWILFFVLAAGIGVSLFFAFLLLSNRMARDAGELEKSCAILKTKHGSGDERMRDKSFFIAHAGQRLRKAVTEIVQHSAALEEQLNQKHHGESADYAAWIRIRGTQILGVINDVLNLAFVESGQVQLMPRAVNLTELLESMAEPLKPLAEDKGLVFVLSLAPSDVWVMGDSDQIWRLVEKIFDNAVKYTQHGEVSITLSALPDGRATIAIRDTGVGIPADALPHIFEPQPFEEEKETRLEEGLGINLSVARQLADMMGSVISVHSEIDKGTTFLIDMPACTPEGQLLAR